MKVGDLLHFERALQRYSVVRIAADEEERVACVTACKLRDLPVHVDGLLQLSRQMLKLLHQGGVALRINAPELFGHVQGC